MTAHSAEFAAVTAPAPASPTARRRRTLLGFVAVAVIVVALYGLLPHLADAGDAWTRISRLDARWLAVAALLEAGSFAGYVVLFRAVFGHPAVRWRESLQVTLAGVAATRVLAAAGAGGVALTAWALRGFGMDPRDIARRMVTFLVLLYAVYVGTLVLAGLGLWSGVLPGHAPLALTAPPALAGIVAIGLALAGGRLGAGRRRGRVWTAIDTVGGGVRGAFALIRTRPPGLVGAPAWWGFDIAVLGVCLHALGADPAVAVLVLSYFVGMLANLLPLPGGIGGVDGGMIGALVACGVPAGAAVPAVLTYRAFAFWLPTLPGALAYVRLRGTLRRRQEAA